MLPPDAEEKVDGWKNTLRKRVSRTSRPTSIFMPDMPTEGGMPAPASLLSTPTLEMDETGAEADPIQRETSRGSNESTTGSLKRSQSKSFAGSMRNAFASAKVTRSRSSTMNSESSAMPVYLGTVGSLASLAKSAPSSRVDLPLRGWPTITPVATNASEAPSEVASGSAAPRERRSTLKRVLSFRRTSDPISNEPTEHAGQPHGTLQRQTSFRDSATEALRSLRHRTSRRLSRVDLLFTPAASPKGASSQGDEPRRRGSAGALAEVDEHGQLVGGAATRKVSDSLPPPPVPPKSNGNGPSATMQSAQRRQLTRLFMQSNRFSPMPGTEHKAPPTGQA